MYLKSLELSGFKSFAKKSSLSFTSTITGIVGPNGSGKSNIAEAFQFVLGEQSIKSLRGKRGEDMIWNGGGDSSSGTGRANRANVRLSFDNSRRIFKDIDFDEVMVERVVHRDNSNEYLLNGSQVRLRDIAELLANAHVGATGHHIISQGEADRVLSSSTRERREIIEDALGLKIYQWKKLESLRKLEKTEENMNQVESLRREIAPHLKFLKKQVEKVERAEEMRKELTTLYKEYFSIEDYYVKTEKERLTNLLSDPRHDLALLDKELEKAKDVLTNSKNKDNKSHELIQLEKKLREERNKKEEIMRDVGRIEGEINANKRAIEKENYKIKNEESKTVYLKDLEEVVRNIESFSIFDDSRKLFSEIVKTLKEFIGKHKSVTDSLFNADLKEEVVKLERDKGELEKKLRSIVEEEKKINDKYINLKEFLEKEKDINRDAEKDVFRIIAKQNELRNIVSDLTNELNKVIHDEESMKRDLGEAGIIIGREALDYASGDQLSVVPSSARRSVSHSASPRSTLVVACDGNDRIDRDVQESCRRQIEKLKIRLEDAGGYGGNEVMKEYRETEERDVFLGKELEDLAKAKAELLKMIIDLDLRIDFEFKSGILKINAEFQKFFVLMFGGGKAELEAVKEVRRQKKSNIGELDEILSEERIANSIGEGSDIQEEGHLGLEVNVSLPRKKVKGLMMLSGGERALTSIALLFAISQVNPPPFIILDETDAALDEANSKKYGDMIEDLSRRSQLILITHNRETMSRAGVLYGITMGSDGASRLLSIAFEEAVKVAK